MRTSSTTPTRIEIHGYLSAGTLADLADRIAIDHASLEPGDEPASLTDLMAAAERASMECRPLVLHAARGRTFGATEDVLRDDGVAFQAVGPFVANGTTFQAVGFDGASERYRRLPHPPEAVSYDPCEGPTPR